MSDDNERNPRISPEDAVDGPVYAHLRRLAASYFRNQQAQTLEPTALVHEAWLKMANAADGAADDDAGFRDRGHFLATAATAMRHILVDKARRRGVRGVRITFGDHHQATPDASNELDLLALDDALESLAKLDARKARIVELRFFTGASIEEAAEAMGIARSTVTEDWRLARAWLATTIAGTPPA